MAPLFSAVTANVPLPRLEVDFSTSPPGNVAGCLTMPHCAFLEVSFAPNIAAVRKETAVTPYDDLQLSLAVWPKAVVSMTGAYVDIAVTVTNSGTASAPDTQFNLQPMPGTMVNPRVVNTAAGAGWLCAAGGYSNGIATCSRGMTVAPGEMAPAVTVRYDIASGAPAGTCVVVGAPRCVRVGSRTWSTTDSTLSEGTRLKFPYQETPTSQCSISPLQVLP